MFNTDLIISQPWGELDGNAKYERMLQRRSKILATLPSYERQLKIVETLFADLNKSHDRILEVACGMGFQLLELSARGWNMTGLEVDPNLCALTNNAAGEFGLSTSLLAGDACQIPLGDETFGACFSHSFFEHVWDVDLALSEQVRVLKPGGMLFIFDGNLYNPRTFLDLLIFYPLRTRGKHGGLKWLFGKRKVHKNLYGYLHLGRDEDIKTPAWWKRRIGLEKRLDLIWAGTGGRYTHPELPSFLQTFLGSCLVIAKKKS